MYNSTMKIRITSIITNKGGEPKEWGEVASLINENLEEAKNFCVEIKTLMKLSKPHEQLIALDLIDYVVDVCNLPLHNQISSKDFITFLLTLLKSKEFPELQYKILSLIKKWGMKFENKRDILPNFFETYNSLRNNKVVFPDKIESNYHQYVNSSCVEESSQITGSNQEKERNAESNYGDVQLDLNPQSYPKKFHTFVSELVTLLNYVVLTNEMIDNADYKQKTVDDGIREMVNTIRELSSNLKMAIENQIDDENLLAICLGVNDDLLKVFQRYSDLKANKKPYGFVSSFHTEYAAYNLNYKQDKSGSIPNKESKSIITEAKESIDSKPKENNNLLCFDSFEPVINTQANKPNSDVSTQAPKKIDESKINDINDIFDLIGNNK